MFLRMGLMELFFENFNKFYLNLVELLFFSENNRPNDKAVEAILRYF